jgi:hypothetical protein
MDSISKNLLPRWVLTNAVTEMIGLGATFALIGGLTPFTESLPPVTAALVSFLIAVASGSIEATLVGLGQWWAMRPWFPLIRRFAWWRATLIGALLAYVLGYLPSTLMSMGETTGEAIAAEPAQWIVLLLAAGLGIVGGAVLSFAQWLVLRKNIRRAGLWLPANMLAWAAGMPLIFQGIDWAFRMPVLWQSVLVVAAMLFIAGAAVGSIHGSFLVKLFAINSHS